MKHASRSDPLERQIITPEGVAVQIRLASRAERLIATVIDGVIVIVGPFLVLLPFIGFSSWILIYALAAFLFRIGYYPLREIKRNGKTIGKSILGIRVIGRSGEPLTTSALFVRNITREVEFWMPLSIYVSLDKSPEGGIQALTLLAWSSVLLLLPLFNRDVMRAGDFLAGTWVIKEPLTPTYASLKLRLKATAQTNQPQGTNAPLFTIEQLSVYGEYELEVLADVLRKQPAALESELALITTRIKKKINWKQTDADFKDPDAMKSKRNSQSSDRAFLVAYYDALRTHLERQTLLTGARPGDKYAAKEARRPGR